MTAKAILTKNTPGSGSRIENKINIFYREA